MPTKMGSRGGSGGNGGPGQKPIATSVVVCSSGSHAAAGFHGSVGQSPVSGQSRAALNNRASQLNPNNIAFHKARGLTSIPNDWHGIAEERRARGRREHALNLAAAESLEARAAHGRDTVHVERAMKNALGGAVQVWKGGGRAKHDNLAHADLDLKIVAPKAIRVEDRVALGAELRREFGMSCVSESNPRIHVVQGEGGPIDVVPFDATFFPQGFHSGKPHNGLKFNPQVRLAVRDVKLDAEQRGCKVRGHDAEMAVLRAQQQHRGAPFSDLAYHARIDLLNVS